MEMVERVKIFLGEELFIYDDQLSFFLNRPDHEKTKTNFESHINKWMLYNAIDEVCDEDPTCNLVWDNDSECAFFNFDKHGGVANRLRELGIL